MNFTMEDRMKLHRYGFDGEGKIIIKGISGMGNEFTTSGTIALFNGKMDIYNDLVIVDLSHNPAHFNGINEKQKICAPFSNTIAEHVIKNIYEKDEKIIENVERTLFINTIEDEKGNVIYENQDYNKIIVPIITDLKQARKEKFSKTNQYMNGSIDNVSAVIQKNIGRPVIIDGFSYVPSGVDTLDELGRPVGVDGSFKLNDYKIYITEKSKISVYDSEKNAFVEAASNDFTDVKDMFDGNKKMIEMAKEAEKGMEK